MDLLNFIQELSQVVWGLPFLVILFSMAVFVTVRLYFVQIRYFLQSAKLLLVPHQDSDHVAESGALSPFQAFINTLGANIGNGTLAGIPVAIHVGGPGSIIWLLIISTFAVALRYAEVFLSVYVMKDATKGNKVLGGPMRYMTMVPGGAILVKFFTTFCLGYMLVSGNLIQCNAIGVAVLKSWNVSQIITAIFILVFILFILLGGAQRIVYYSDKLVPLKVYGFLCTAIALLIYHYQTVPHAFYLMYSGAFSPQAFIGGTFLYALQKSIAVGFQQGINASEAGLGTSAVPFSNTRASHPERLGILSMLSVYINMHVMCLLVALCVLASGVWDNGETSSALLISSYETLFGSFAGYIVTILIISFAMSVLVANAYNGKLCWDVLLNGKFPFVFPVLYVGCAFYGTLMNASIVWNIGALINAVLFVLNGFAILYFLQTMRKELQSYSKRYE